MPTVQTVTDELYFVFVALNCSGFNSVLSSQKAIPNAKVGFSKAMSAGWLEVDKKVEGGPKVLRKVCHFCYHFFVHLGKLYFVVFFPNFQ